MSVPPLLKRRKPQTQLTECEGGEVGKIIEKVKIEVDPYAAWSNPQPWELQGCVNTLHKFVQSLHPKLLLCACRFILERIREDNGKAIDEYCRSQGGWQAIERDMRKAERWILELYERELREGEA